MMRERFRIAAALAGLLDEDAEFPRQVDHALDRHAKLRIGPLLVDLLKTVCSTFAPSASTGRTHGVLVLTRPALLVLPLPLVVQFRFFRMCTKPHACPFSCGVVLLGVCTALRKSFRFHGFSTRVPPPTYAAVDAGAVGLRRILVERFARLRLSTLRTPLDWLNVGKGCAAAVLAPRSAPIGAGSVSRENLMGLCLAAFRAPLHAGIITCAA